MSILGALLGLIGVGTVYGVANSKSKKQIQTMRNSYNSQFKRGCDPETEYKIACYVFKKILELEEKIDKQVLSDLENLSWQELFKKYPDIVERGNRSVRDFYKKPPLEVNEHERKLFLNPRFGLFRMYITEETVENEFLTECERQSFVQPAALMLMSSKSFEQSVAYTVAAREMRIQNFTPVSLAKSPVNGGFYGGLSEYGFPYHFVRAIKCDPTEQDVAEAVRTIGFLGCAKRSGMAKFPYNTTENNEINKKADGNK